MRNLFLVAFGVGDARDKAKHIYADRNDQQEKDFRKTKFSAHCHPPKSGNFTPLG